MCVRAGQEVALLVTVHDWNRVGADKLIGKVIILPRGFSDHSWHPLLTEQGTEVRGKEGVSQILIRIATKKVAAERNFSLAENDAAGSTLGARSIESSQCDTQVKGLHCLCVTLQTCPGWSIGIRIDDTIQMCI